MGVEGEVWCVCVCVVLLVNGEVRWVFRGKGCGGWFKVWDIFG